MPPSHTPKRVRFGRSRLAWIIASALLILLLIAFAFPWNLNPMRGWVGRKVQDSTGRYLAIDGNLILRWGIFRRGGTHISAEGLRFANPDWGSRPEMLKVDRVEAQIALLPLFKGSIVFPAVTVDRPDAQFEQLADGRRNWYLDRKQSDSSTPIQIGALTLNTGHLSYIFKDENTDVQADVATERGGGGGAAKASAIVAHATGRFRGLKLDARLRGDDVLRLRDTSSPYGFQTQVVIGETRVSGKGSLTGLLAPVAADVKLMVSGNNLAQWYPITNIGLPESPPYETDGELSLKDGVWHYDKFKGRLGNSDLSGSIAFEPRGEQRPKRAFISGTLTSKALDLKDLGPLIGKKPAADEPSAPAVSGVAATRKTGKPSAAAASTAQGARALPQIEFKSDKWDTLDADLQVHADQIRNLGSLPFDNLTAHIQMQDKVLTLAPLRFGFASGELNNQLRIDGRTSPMQARIDGQFRNLQLARLLPSTNTSKAAFGNVNGKIVLDGRGDSVAQMLGSSTGKIQIAMGRGVMSNLLLELVDLDAAEAIRFLFAGDKTVTIRCAIADLDMKNGMMTPKALVFDTTDTIVNAEGHANFADETLDMRITPVPKDKSFLTLRVPFTVKGTFKKRSISPDKTLLAARVGSSVLLGLLNPLAALLPLIETGPGEDSDCTGLLSHLKNVPVKSVGTKSDSDQPVAKAKLP